MKAIFTFAFLLFTFYFLSAQSNIQQSVSINPNGTLPDPSAMLDVQATNKGMLIPRLTTAQRTAIAFPATGLLVYDTNTNGFWFHNGTAWINLTVSKTLADGDGNTKVQVEESANEDIIRFDLGGTEEMVLRKNASGFARLELPDATFNLFVGQNAGSAIDSGVGNTFLGSYAGSQQTTGDGNTGIGALALFDNASSSNTAIGNNALRYNLLGGNNTAVGGDALLLNTNGEYNTATGAFALHQNITGSNNTANGRYALYYNTGSENTATGSSALFANMGGLRNTANGFGALYSNTGGNNNAAFGANALVSNSSGYSNAAFGKDALYFNTVRSNLVAVGDSALYKNGTGASAAYHGTGNAALGSKSLYANTKGYENTAIGFNAMRDNAEGYGNTAVGWGSLRNNSIGANLALDEGARNTAVGDAAMFFNTTGGFNCALGYVAMQQNTSGYFNTALGYAALSANTTGHDNTATGLGALEVSSGNFNTANGSRALDNNTTGSENTALGYNADVAANSLANATVIGSNAIGSASNKVRIGNASVTVIEGAVDWTFPSDARFKFNIRDEGVPGLAFINQLRPVTYQFDARKFDLHLMQNMPDSMQQSRLLSGQAGQDYSESTALVQTGFLAQEVEQVCKDLNFNFSGLHVPTSEVDNYGLAYGSFVPLLVKGMQEQQAIIEAQKEEISILKSQLDKIAAALAEAGIAVEK